MENYFTPMNERYKNKNYPHGFLAGASKNLHSAGTALFVLSVVLFVLFIPLTIFGIYFAVHGMLGGVKSDMSGGLLLTVIGLVFVIPAIFCFRYGRKLKRKTSSDLPGEWAKKFNYTESVIQNYIDQALDNDTLIIHIAGDFEADNGTGIGLLTRDFLGLNGAIMKREDIIAIYLVKAADTVSAGNKIKTVYILKIAVCAKNCSVMSPAKEEAVNELISMLIKENPNLQTKPGVILSEKEFKEITQELSATL